jgi:hypothetical protein
MTIPVNASAVLPIGALSLDVAFVGVSAAGFFLTPPPAGGLLVLDDLALATVRLLHSNAEKNRLFGQ